MALKEPKLRDSAISCDEKRSVVGEQPTKQYERAVGGAVNDEDDLERRIELIRELVEAIDEGRERRLVLVHGNDDGVDRVSADI